MNDLKDLLIQRIKDVKLLQDTLLNTQLQKNTFDKNKIHADSNASILNSNLQIFFSQFPKHQNEHITQRSDQSRSSQNKKNNNKIHFLVKKRQKNRSKTQNQLIIALNNSFNTFLNHKQIQDFYLLSLEIFQSFDSQFSKYKNQSLFMSVSMQQNLKKLYSFFFLKHDQEESGKSFIPQMSKLEIMDLGPSFFLGWIKKWSSSILQSLLNLNEDNNEFKIGVKLDVRKIKEKINSKDLTFDIFANKNRSNSHNFMSKNMSFIQSPHKKAKQNKTLKSDATFQSKIAKLLSNLQVNESQILIPINSKQMVYSYCLQELKNYYKNYPFEDLDYGYLRGFKKVGRKDEILVGLNCKNAIQTLIESKNASIKSSMTKYSLDFDKFRTLRQNNILKRHKNLTEIKTESQNQHFISQNDSKLLSPLKKNKNHKLKNKFSNENTKIDFLFRKQTQKQTQQKESHQNSCSNSMELKQQIINYNQIFSQNNIKQIQEDQTKIQLLKKFNQRLKKDLIDTGKQSQPYYSQKQKISPFFCEINQQNINVNKLPKLSLKAKSKQSNNKKILNTEIQERFNKSELISQKKKALFHEKLNTELNNILYPQNVELQRIAQKEPQEFVGQRYISQISSNQDKKRSASLFSSNSKLFLGSKKPSLNMVKITKNKILLSQQSKFSIVTTLKNKLKDKISITKNLNQNSENLRNNVFSSEKIPLNQEPKKDQFIEYLKSLHREKIKSQVFQNKQMKQKQKHIKSRSP